LFCHNFGIRITIGMVFGKELDGIFGAALSDVPTGRFRHEEGTAKNDSGKDTLDKSGNPPGSGSRDVGETIDQNGSRDTSDEPTCVVKAGGATTEHGVGNLDNVGWSGGCYEDDPKTDNETTGHEKGRIGGSNLKDGTDNNDYRANGHATSTTNPVNDGSDEKATTNGTNLQQSENQGFVGDILKSWEVILEGLQVV